MTYISKTGSVAQDALLEGYQITCHSGLANLLKIKDLTIASCQSFIPLAIKESQEKVKHYEKLCIEYFEKIKGYYDAKKIVDMPEYFYTWYYTMSKSFQKKAKDAKNIVDFISNNRYICNDAKSYYCSEPRIDSLNGRIEIDIFKITFDNKEDLVYKYSLAAKSAQMEYVDYNAFTDYLIPDHVTKEIVRAREIGLTQIRIVQPIIVDTKIIDPLVIGYVEEKRNGQTPISKMFLITRFGFNKAEDKMLADCSKECSI